MYKTRNMNMDYGSAHPDGLFSTYGRHLSNSDLVSWSPLMPGHFNTPSAYPYLASFVYETPPPGIVPGSETFWSTEFKQPIFNECWHVKSQALFNKPYQILTPSGNGLWWYWPCHRYSWSYPLRIPSKVPGSFEVSDFTRARAWATMRVRYEAEFEMLNALFELKDFRDIARNFGKLTKPGLGTSFLQKLGRVGTASVQRRKPIAGRKIYSAGEALDAAVNTVAGSWLLLQMAIKPTIKDIIALSAAASQIVADHQKKFKVDGESLQKRHYSEVVSDQSTQYYQGTGLGYQDWLQAWERDTQTYTATMHYTYDYVMRETRDAFIRYWGLTGTVEEFWNMIPGSFVLDYFAQIGKSLRQAQIDPNVELRVLQYCESITSRIDSSYGVRTSSSMRRLIIDGATIDPSINKYFPLAGISRSYFERRTTSPYKGIILPKLRTPSSLQKLNCVALLKTLF